MSMKSAIRMMHHKPRNTDDCQQTPEAGRQGIYSALQASEKPTWLTPDLRISSLQNCETINFCCVRHPFVIFCACSPDKLTPSLSDLIVIVLNAISMSASPIFTPLSKTFFHIPDSSIQFPTEFSPWRS